MGGTKGTQAPYEGEQDKLERRQSWDAIPVIR